MKTMTVDEIMLCKPCYNRKKVENLWDGKDSLSFVDVSELDVLESDKIWAGVNCYMDDKQRRLFAVRCARQALALVTNPHYDSVTACDVAERFANGEATLDELSAARDAAMSAWSAAESAARPSARSARSAAMSAESAAMSAESAARDAAMSAAESAAESAARSAARSAGSAVSAEHLACANDIRKLMKTERWKKAAPKAQEK